MTNRRRETELDSTGSITERILLSPRWDLPSTVRAGYTTRLGGSSEGCYASLNLADHVGDDSNTVEKNRLRLSREMPDMASIQWLSQVHGHRVIKAGQESIPEADATWTEQPGVACAVMTADCLPVLLAARDGRCVAAVHAGWRGLLNGVIEETVEQLPVNGGELTVWLGPAIGPEEFEVGAEVRAMFVDSAASADLNDTKRSFQPSARTTNRFMADIYNLARIRLRSKGISEVSGGDLCTVRDSRLFSYRRDGTTGRMASLIWIEMD